MISFATETIFPVRAFNYRIEYIEDDKDRVRNVLIRLY